MRIGSAVSAVHIVPTEEAVVVDTPVPIAAEVESEELLISIG